MLKVPVDTPPFPTAPSFAAKIFLVLFFQIFSDMKMQIITLSDIKGVIEIRANVITASPAVENK
jgi:hypothetical protein